MNARRFRVVSIPLAGIVLLSGLVASPAAAADEPRLTLIAATDQIQLERSGRGRVWLDLGVYLAAESAPLEVLVRRAAYDQPFEAVLRLPDGSTRRLDEAQITKLEVGFRRFFDIVIRDRAGTVVRQFTRAFCPNGWEQVRLSADAADTTRFPFDCGWSPLALGSVWGLEQGWAAGIAAGSTSLAEGTYSIQVSVTDRYRTLFAFDAPSVEMEAVVKTVRRGRCCPTKPRPLGSDEDDDGPKGEQPGEPTIPGPSARPDLVAGPAWSIATRAGRKGNDWLEFAAMVWNAGPANLVVDGFRKRGEEMMEAYQSFYENGQKVGTVSTGNLVYDPRPGHQHWHFLDFASYRLLDESGTLVKTSGKEAFCLAPTDAVDLTVPGAVYRPDSIGFGTACGGRNALSIREVLQSGWGDTYYQSVPGQAINITGVPNGTYYLQVIANPDGRLYEVTADNNETRRKVVLSGSRGARSVEVFPYQGLEF